ncbi:hypothetical protein [Streptomyces sp. NPDC000877]|uniref:hypothetical protein n=1 Tax=Streptomyces sp. NPDC000877 TaxID=3154370 RepID=UPI00333481C7
MVTTTGPTAPAGITGAIRVDVNSGPSASLAGLQLALRELQARGATFDTLPKRYAAEWAELFPDADHDGPPIAEIALAPSERRLHRESEQNYRVLSAAATALCTGSAELGAPLLVEGLGGTDLASLRGFMRAVERARVQPDADILLESPHLIRTPLAGAADFRAERVRCLRRMGLDIGVADLVPQLPSAGPDPVDTSAAGNAGREARLWAGAFGDGMAFDRLAAVLAGCRLGFFSGNWEAMAALAELGRRLLEGFPDNRVEELIAAARAQDGQAEAIEFEAGIVRTSDDARAFLAKMLGVQATFRGRQDQALEYFRAMRAGERLSPEVRAQSHLYSALTLTKRLEQVGEAIVELDEGFAALPNSTSQSDSVRRERGWLHNLRALTHFAQRELRDAFGHEKRALVCIEGLNDPSSIHLRINLLSNVSVLQEKAGHHAQAVSTWARFKRAAGSSSAGFVKHHAYRAAGLALLMGERDAALEDLSKTLACTAEFNDDFHETEVSLEVGRLLLDSGTAAQAAEHYDRADAAAGRIGDPYRMALAQVGRAATVGTAPGAQTGAVARLSLTHPERAERLAASVAAGEASELLPRVRTKLNRPFDLINFQE